MGAGFFEREWVRVFWNADGRGFFGPRMGAGFLNANGRGFFLNANGREWFARMNANRGVELCGRFFERGFF
jgi:uncharacterized pyridoxamine 5'-phosphate oxidase family protein